MSNPGSRARVAKTSIFVALILVGAWILRPQQDHPIGVREASPLSKTPTEVPIAPRPDASSVRRSEGDERHDEIVIDLTVREAGGAPLELAEVCYVEALRAGTAITDKDGRARLKISDAKDGAAAAARYGSWLRESKSVLLVHAPQHVWHIDRSVELEKRIAAHESLTIELARGVQLRGIVKDARDSKPVTKATFFVGGGNGIGEVMTQFDRFDEATGDDGVFEIGLLEGKAAALTFPELDFIALTTAGAAHSTLTSGEALDVELALDSAHLSIDVRDEGDHPIFVASAHATPARAQGALATARMPTHYPIDLERDFLFSKSDGKGRIELERLPPLTHSFRFAVDVSANGFKTTALDVTFEKNIREKTVKAVLKPSAGISIHGVVRDRQGRPIEGAVVESTNSTLPRVTTDANGQYRLDAPSLGRSRWWYPRVKKEGYVDYRWNYDLTTKGADVTFDFTLWKVAPISGVVVDSTGAPVEGAYVELRLTQDAPLPNSVRTDAQGRFNFDPGGEGPWTLTASKHRKQGDAVPPHYLRRFCGMVEGGTMDYVVVLERVESGATIDLEVVHGKVAEPVAVDAGWAHFFDNTTSEFAMPRVDGSHVLCEGLEPGRYQVSAVAGKEYGSMEVTVPSASAIVKARLCIGGHGSIEGRIVGVPNPAGFKITMNWATPMLEDGPWAKLFVSGKRVLAEMQSLPDGSFVLEDVPAGLFTIRASGQEGHFGESGKADVKVEDGETVHLDLVATNISNLHFNGLAPEGVDYVFVIHDAAGNTQTFSDHRSNSSTDDQTLAYFEVAPGEYSWTVETSTRTSGGKKITWRPRQEGKVVVGVRETKIVRLEFK